MKCDELKSVYIDRTGDWARSGNDTGKFYLKKEVDAVIADLQKTNAMLTENAVKMNRELESLKASHYADKVLALLKDKANYNEYAYKHKSKEFADTCRFYEKELRRHKYKRCLATAMWCESTSLWCYQAACTLPKGFHATLHGKPVMIEPTRLFKRHELLTKWSERWMKLAEKFKGAK